MQELYVVRMLGIRCRPGPIRLSLRKGYNGGVSQRDHQMQVLEHTAVFHSSVLLHPYTLTSVFR